MMAVQNCRPRNGDVAIMARPLRIEYPGAIYHVTCRMLGDALTLRGYGGASWPPEKRLFRDEADHERFLGRLAERVEQFHVRLYLFVCMTNHFHLVFETPQANCSKFMHSLSTAYTVYYNLRHGRHGHLLDGRFKAKLVEGDDYLLALSRYVHLNPVQVAAQRNKSIDERINLERAVARQRIVQLIHSHRFTEKPRRTLRVRLRFFSNR
jgi:putative transposase